MRKGCRGNRRQFLQAGSVLAAGLCYSMDHLAAMTRAEETPGRRANSTGAKVAIVSCPTYGAEVRGALKRCFDLLGGVGALARGKTVTVKINLTGTSFLPFLGRPVGESYMTHYATVLALTDLLFANGARRVRLVESTNSLASLRESLVLADWGVAALEALGRVEFENTRNLGDGKRYATLKVPGGGYLFSSFDLNHSYADTDAFISLTKLKYHVTAGVTLSMKNLFGITPNSLYGDEAGSEEARAGRGPLHGPGAGQTPERAENFQLPGMKVKFLEAPRDPGLRVPRTIADLCAARPVDLAIIDGITTMTSGEGPWCVDQRARLVKPGLLIAGLNPVSTDAVAAALMGVDNPRAQRGTAPFAHCENHLLLAEKAGIGVADLGKIEILGSTIEKSRFPFPGAS